MTLPGLLVLAAVSAAGVVGRAQQPTNDNIPFPPHKVIGNVYYVGSSYLASFLIATPQGHILINSGYTSTVPVIKAAVETLGFRFEDVKILLGSHGHDDHMEGGALVKQLTGAQVMAMEQDLPLLRNITTGGKPHPVDRVLHDRDEVALGGTTLVARLTPGHTEGCTTWTMKVQEGARSFDVVIVCSVGVNAGYVLVNNLEYPQIAEDYVRSFAILRALPVDVFLGAHGSFYDMEAKYARLQKTPAQNPFIDPAGLNAYLDAQEDSFYGRLERQKKTR